MKKITLATAAVAALASGQAWSATGNDLIRWLPDYERGIANWQSGMYLGFVSGIASFSNGILFCAPNSTNGQNAAVVAKFLRNNPERWGEDAPKLVIDALKKGYPQCKGS